MLKVIFVTSVLLITSPKVFAEPSKCQRSVDKIFGHFDLPHPVTQNVDLARVAQIELRDFEARNPLFRVKTYDNWPIRSRGIRRVGIEGRMRVPARPVMISGISNGKQYRINITEFPRRLKVMTAKRQKKLGAVEHVFTLNADTCEFLSYEVGNSIAKWSMTGWPNDGGKCRFSSDRRLLNSGRDEYYRRLCDLAAELNASENAATIDEPPAQEKETQRKGR